MPQITEWGRFSVMFRLQCGVFFGNVLFTVFGVKPNGYDSPPLPTNCHPELDESEFLVDEDGIKQYQSVIGAGITMLFRYRTRDSDYGEI
jgi:hypothetical protein